MKSSNGRSNGHKTRKNPIVHPNGQDEDDIPITESDVIAYELKQDFGLFTRYFYKTLGKKKFLLNGHHVEMFDVLQKVVKGEIRRLMINMPPRYVKTSIVVHHFIPYGFAINPASKFIHLSYADELARDNSEKARDIIKSAEYQHLFPTVRIKQETDSKKKWYTVKGGGVYATGTAGSVTGFGAGDIDLDEEDIEDLRRLAEQEQDEELFAELEEMENQTGFAGALIIDDPMKPDDADNETIRNKINNRWDSTISSRLNSRKTPVIIDMQRLHENDLCGYLLEMDGAYNEKTNPEGWHVLTLPAILDEGLPTERALWPRKHTLQELKKIRDRNPIVFGRQYQQQGMPVAGLLYKVFKTYTALPFECNTSKRKNVTDTADEGSDWLCSIDYIPTKTAYYVIDVYYTDSGMEVTEEAMAVRLTANNIHSSKIESNNGGRSFARNVERICRTLGNRSTSFVWFHQSKNKNARILTNAATVQNMVIFPHDWEKRWPKFAMHVKTYMAKGKNATDDPEDTLTMLVEEEQPKSGNNGVRRTN